MKLLSLCEDDELRNVIGELQTDINGVKDAGVEILGKIPEYIIKIGEVATKLVNCTNLKPGEEVDVTEIPSDIVAKLLDVVKEYYKDKRLFIRVGQ